MKIMFSEKAHSIFFTHSIFFRNKKYCCAFLFSLISISFHAQIFQSSNSQLYVSEGATVVEIHDESIIENIKPIKGDFYISKNAVVSDDQKNLFAKVVDIEDSKIRTTPLKHLAVSHKKQKEKEQIEPTIKSSYSFECSRSSLFYDIGNQIGKFISTISNTQLVGVFSSQTKIDYRKIILGKSIKSFYKNKGLSKISETYFSIRPPPIVC